MTQYRYTVYDTGRREYLERVERPTGDDRAVVTVWTKKVERAAKFPGVKSAAAIVRLLGNYSQFVIKNREGVIVG